MASSSLHPFAPNIWTKDYNINYFGCTFFGRMTVVKLSNGNILIHSPCNIDDETKKSITDLCSENKNSVVEFIIAPGNFHHLHVASCQRAFPSAKTYICHGVEKKQPKLQYDGVLSDTPEVGWADDFDQIVVRGNRVIWEVVFFHKPTSTLILVDLVENIGDMTPGTNWVLRFWWKYVFRMWNVPKPAPEYQMGWEKDKTKARESLRRIMDWKFDSVIIAHGENIREDARNVVETAWRDVLTS